LAGSFAEQLLAGFPPFDAALARNEIYGGVWGKAANPKIRVIASVYKTLYDLIESRAFLDFISKITDIPDLLFDPTMFGGGTHEHRPRSPMRKLLDFRSWRLRRRSSIMPKPPESQPKPSKTESMKLKMSFGWVARRNRIGVSSGWHKALAGPPLTIRARLCLSTITTKRVLGTCPNRRSSTHASHRIDRPMRLA
jgi:hypothetical protein